MPIADYSWGKHVNATVEARRSALIKKWRDMGCTERKIKHLIWKRINSKRQWW